MLVYLNGEYVEKSRAMVSLDDRGFLFADGIYEVLRAVDGRFIERDRHVRRLQRNARELRLELTDDAIAALPEVALQLMERNGVANGHALVYLEVTRGVALRRHAFPPAGTAPTVYVSASRFTPLDDLQEHGVSVITHPDLRWARCDIKSINLLPNVLANQLAHERDCYEAVLIRDGVVTEATHSSLFGVVNGTLRTHPANERILPSVTREVVLELVRDAGLKHRESAMSEKELSSADELFLASTTADVMPVIAVDGKRVGEGTPGVITRQLQQAFRWHVRGAVRA